jgi:hypothetical protein
MFNKISKTKKGTGSLSIMIWLAVFYICMLVVFGWIGQDGLLQNKFGTIEAPDMNSSSTFSASDLPSFYDGIKFTFAGLPDWLAFVLGVLPPLLFSLAFIWFLRGI